ncbi:MAG: MFS transporter [Chloroflexi bacterium]|nr:MFS transporter [Chloroflexota bacterium]MCY3937274.1 MFS transporter [Chloroflexota bacterium]
MIGNSPNPKRVSGFLTDHRLIVLLAVQFLSGVAAAPMVAFLPVYVDEVLKLDQDFTANARAVWLAGMGLFAVAGGALSDAAGRKFTIVLGLTGMLAGAAIFVTRSPLAVGLLLPGIVGAADGLFVTGSQAYLVEASPKNRLAVMTALWFSGLTAGNVVGGLAGGAVAEWAGYSALALYIAAATGGVAVLALLLLPNMWRGSPGPRPGLRQTLAGYALLLRQTSYRLLVAMQMLRTFFWGGFQIMGPVMIAGLSGSKFVVGAFVSATTGVGLASMLLVGAFSDRRGRRGPVLICLGGTALGSALIGLTTGNLLGLFLAGTLAAVFAWALSGQVTPLAKEFARPGETGRAMALINAPWSVAALGGAQIGGRMVTDQPAGAFFIFAGLALVALLCGIVLFRLAAPARS